MIEEKISIIVPVYNAELYLDQCISSIINQTYKNIEIILVNDGSTDNSLKICQEYAKKDERMVVLNKENGGVSSARNLAINKAKGNYIAFIDSDDWIHKEFIELLYKNIKESSADLSVCSIKRLENNQDKIESTNIINLITLNQKESYDNLVLNSNYYGYCCNKLYSMRILKKMGEKPINEELHMCEDLEFNARYLQFCKKTVFVEKYLYYYRVNYNGMTENVNFNEKVLTVFNAYDKTLKIVDNYSKKAYDNILYNYLIMQLNVNYKYYMLNKKYGRLDIEKYREVMKSKEISRYKKMYIYITFKFPIFTSKIKRKLRTLAKI